MFKFITRFFNKTLSNSRRYIAFTLAEVLITLGIIGIVASLTIPTLIANTQKQEFVSGLKKAYSNLSNGFKLYMADEGVSDFGSTSIFDGTDFTDSNRQDKIDQMIRKYFKVIKTCKYGDGSCQINAGYLNLTTTGSLFRSDMYSFFTSDGMAFTTGGIQTSCVPDSSKIGKMKTWCAAFWIDVNGAKKPNKEGRDMFLFWLDQDGTLNPAGGIEYAKYNCGSTWQTCTNYWQASNQSGNCDSTVASAGAGCSGRIMEEGWQMNY